MNVMRNISKTLSSMLLGVLFFAPLASFAEESAVTTPTDSATKNVSATRAVLTWQLAEEDATVAYFNVEVSQDDAVVVTKSRKKQKAIVTGLTPSTTYSFAVQSVSKDGSTSDWSEAVEFTTMGAAQYVKLVDTSSSTSDTVWPGSDLDAVKLVKASKKSYYATEVMSSDIKNGLVGNSHQNVEQALGKPDYNETLDTGYVSLGGPEAYVVLKLGSTIDETARKLKIYEIGGDQGGADEVVNVFVAENADGPWVSIGKGTGPFVVEL